MVDVYNIIFQLFNMTITSLKKIPITQNVSLYDFSIAVLILTIVAVAFIPLVKVGSTDYVNESLRSERIERDNIQRENDRLDSQIESRKYALLNRSQKKQYIQNLENKRKK